MLYFPSSKDFLGSTFVESFFCWHRMLIEKARLRSMMSPSKLRCSLFSSYKSADLLAMIESPKDWPSERQLLFMLLPSLPGTWMLRRAARLSPLLLLFWPPRTRLIRLPFETLELKELPAAHSPAFRCAASLSSVELMFLDFRTSLGEPSLLSRLLTVRSMAGLSGSTTWLRDWPCKRRYCPSYE